MGTSKKALVTFLAQLPYNDFGIRDIQTLNTFTSCIGSYWSEQRIYENFTNMGLQPVRGEKTIKRFKLTTTENK